MRYLPKKIPNRQRLILKSMLQTASNHCPCSIKFTVSKEKVEKVVKPPKRPVVRNGSQREAVISYFAAHWVMAPINTAPRKLARRVPKGNADIQM